MHFEIARSQMRTQHNCNATHTNSLFPIPVPMHLCTLHTAHEHIMLCHQLFLSSGRRRQIPTCYTPIIGYYPMPMPMPMPMPVPLTPAMHCGWWSDLLEIFCAPCAPLAPCSLVLFTLQTMHNVARCWGCIAWLISSFHWTKQTKVVI